MIADPESISRGSGTRPSDGTPLLDRRALNRALLARQMLLGRRRIPVDSALEHLVGMQAQVSTHPYVSLWSRLDAFQPDELGRLISDRLAVRMPLLRTTIHLVTARDALAIYPIVRQVHESGLRRSPFGRGIEGVDVDALLAAGRDLLEERPWTLVELGSLLGVRWPDRAPENLAYAVRHLLPLVQIPPRGLWDASGQATWTTVEAWLGCPVDADPSLDALVLRYLAAFGPASASDVRAWSGVGDVRESLVRLSPRLRRFRDEQGRELVDLPDAPRPDADTPVPPRFLPGYDNVFLSHFDRGRIVSDENRSWQTTANGVGPGAILVDGFIRGTWRLTRDRGSATLAITPLEHLSAPDRAAVADEGARLLAFAARGESHKVLLVDGSA